MECETKLGKYGDAKTRSTILSSKNNLRKEHVYILSLLNARIELHRLMQLKRATVREGKYFEKLFLRALRHNRQQSPCAEGIHQAGSY